MQRIVYLSFYFNPDLCAGSFRNSPLALELASQAKSSDIIVDVYTTMPNRYSTYDKKALAFEQIDNLRIHRISLPPHKSGMLDQVISFLKYYNEVSRLNKGKSAKLVFASSSRLFSAYLGFKIARELQAPLYLDIRDIFVDTMNDVLKSKLLKTILFPFLKKIEKLTFNYASHINLISGGFKEYFEKFQKVNYSFFTNGIDNEFIFKETSDFFYSSSDTRKIIVYAGNLGESQGLHKIIPQSAKLLSQHFQFLIIGDGSAKKDLLLEIERLKLDNVIVRNPVDRKDLLKIYNSADFLFLHLNDYPAFRKVLPSKIFELATFNKPILAGVAGHSANFIQNEVSNSFVFEPCNVEMLVNYLLNCQYDFNINRKEFIEKFRRDNINYQMSKSILSYL